MRKKSNVRIHYIKKKIKTIKIKFNVKKKDAKAVGGYSNFMSIQRRILFYYNLTKFLIKKRQFKKLFIIYYRITIILSHFFKLISNRDATYMKLVLRNDTYTRTGIRKHISPDYNSRLNINREQLKNTHTHTQTN